MIGLLLLQLAATVVSPCNTATKLLFCVVPLAPLKCQSSLGELELHLNLLNYFTGFLTNNKLLECNIRYINKGLLIVVKIKVGPVLTE